MSWIWLPYTPNILEWLLVETGAGIAIAWLITRPIVWYIRKRRLKHD